MASIASNLVLQGLAEAFGWPDGKATSVPAGVAKRSRDGRSGCTVEDTTYADGRFVASEREEG